jgi:deoxyribonuclease-4
MVNALTRAEALGLDTVQVFTKNQQQWKAKPLDADMVAQWKSKVQQLGWQDRIVSHASYLINLASASDELWNKSLDLMVDEIERCETLGIAFLVHHPGSFVNSTLEAGLARIAQAYREIFRRTSGYRTISCLEGTVGGGSSIGGPFEHLAALRSRIADATTLPDRVGFCLDSCHMHAFGYDMSSVASAASALEQFDSLCGLSNLKVWHLNDSKGKLASKLDRHQHIGEGWIGGGASLHTGKGTFSFKSLQASGFAAIVNHPAFLHVPKIMETPKDDDLPAGAKPGEEADLVNLARLKSLMRSTPKAESAPPGKAKSPRTRRTSATKAPAAKKKRGPSGRS